MRERERSSSLGAISQNPERQDTLSRGSAWGREFDMHSDIKKQAVRRDMSTSSLPTHKETFFFFLNFVD